MQSLFEIWLYVGVNMAIPFIVTGSIVLFDMSRLRNRLGIKINPGARAIVIGLLCSVYIILFGNSIHYLNNHYGLGSSPDLNSDISVYTWNFFNKLSDASTNPISLILFYVLVPLFIYWVWRKKMISKLKSQTAVVPISETSRKTFIFIFFTIAVLLVIPIIIVFWAWAHVY